MFLEGNFGSGKLGPAKSFVVNPEFNSIVVSNLWRCKVWFVIGWTKQEYIGSVTNGTIPSDFSIQQEYTTVYGDYFFFKRIKTLLLLKNVG